MSLIPKLNFTCSYGFHFRDNRLFGFDCFGPVNPVYEAILDGSTAVKKVRGLPSCDNVCQNSGASQPNYDQFLTLNRTKLQSFCKADRTKKAFPQQEMCRFNQGSPFD